MNFNTDFRLTSVSGKIPQLQANPLAPIDILVGTWKGRGFNQIWRPFFDPQDPTKDHFLELNETTETLELGPSLGDIPNRGLLQTDINLHGITYLQKISDAHVKEKDGEPSVIHVEPGIWLTVPQTGNPADEQTVARMGNIPHGTSFVAQGKALLPVTPGAPPFAPVSITPFAIGQPGNLVPFPGESNLTNPSQFRTPKNDIPNVTQAMVDNPNSVLEDLVLADAAKGEHIISTTTFHVSTTALNPPSTGGGTSNIAFLLGAPNPNAQSAHVECTFWVETVQLPHGGTRIQLQYTQAVLLNFNTLSWPHVSVATLVKQ